MLKTKTVTQATVGKRNRYEKNKNKGFKKARHVRLILFPCSLDMKSYANVCAARPAGVSAVRAARLVWDRPTSSPDNGML